MNLKIVPYQFEDNESALTLEKLCPQGKNLTLGFVRPTFHARSEVYEKYKILTAKINNQLCGVAAGAIKKLKVGNKFIQAVYGYDLRIHPDFRRYGTAKILSETILKEFGTYYDCIYTLIAAENERALSFVKRNFGAKVAIPLTYFIFPVFKIINENIKPNFYDANENHQNYLQANPEIDFVPEFNEKLFCGHVKSLLFGSDAGCSIWTNENLLSEQVVKLNAKYNLLRIMFNSLNYFIKLPTIPNKGEIIQSWFIYDLYASNIEYLKKLLISVNNLAYINGKKYIYLLLQEGDRLNSLIQKLKKIYFKHSYIYLAKGNIHPNNSTKIYLDIRDL